MTKINNKLIVNTALLFALFALAACNTVKQELGVGRNSPDEFLVVKRAPLTLPPDYTLRPPAAAGDPAERIEEANNLKSSLLGTSPTQAKTTSADEALLDKLGATAANQDIRQQLDEENGYLSLKNRSVAQKLIHWDDEQYVPPAENIPASIVDPAAEAARLKKNKTEGKPLNEGEVPTIKKSKNTLEKLF